MSLIRRILVIGIVAGAFSEMASAQSTLNFPRMLSVTDQKSTGLAVINPSSAAATATFTLYSATGASIAASNQTVPAAGQLAKLAAELFPTATGAGWIQMTSATSGLQGFWLGGDFVKLTNADGAAAATPASDQILSVETTEPEINIANPGTSAISITVQLFDFDGNIGYTATKSIPAHGVYQVLGLFSIFGETPDPDERGELRVRSTGGSFVATVVSEVANSDIGVINGVDATVTGASTLELNFPHLVDGPGGGGIYRSIIQVHDLSGRAQTLRFTLTPESGSPITATVSLPANGTIRDYAFIILGLDQTKFYNGWLKVTGTTGITGLVAYQGQNGVDTTINSVSAADVPVQLTPSSNLFFAHIADLSPWLTGLALLNASTTDANVEVYAMNPSGTLIAGAANVATAKFTLGAGKKIAKLLSELIPQTQTRTSDGGFVFVRTTNNVPLYGIELFFTRNLTVSVNVAGSTLPAGTTYTPPAP